MKLSFPATSRNRDAILSVLREVFAPPVSRVCEVASGTGEHAGYFAAAMPWLSWQPTDLDPAHLASIDAWAHESDPPLVNLAAAVALDVAKQAFPGGPYDGVFCANMVHIVPWNVAEGLFAGAADALRTGGALVTYGPYTVGGNHTAPSNVEFDASLKVRDERWGVRDIAALAALSSVLHLEQTIPMPANNFCLVFRRSDGPGAVDTSQD